LKRYGRAAIGAVSRAAIGKIRNFGNASHGEVVDVFTQVPIFPVD
jgi:hypothetical protein